MSLLKPKTGEQIRHRQTMAFDRNNHLWRQRPSRIWEGPNKMLRATYGDVKAEFGPMTPVRHLPVLPGTDPDDHLYFDLDATGPGRG